MAGPIFVDNLLFVPSTGRASIVVCVSKVIGAAKGGLCCENYYAKRCL